MSIPSILAMQSSSGSLNKPRPPPNRQQGNNNKNRPQQRPCPPGQQQEKRRVKLFKPMPAKPNIAIIGGGLSGLVTSIELARRGITSTVFDTGEHGVGGRMGTRSTSDGSLSDASTELVFDHAAQYFTATDASFQGLVANWQKDGAVKEWTGPVGTLDSTTHTFTSSYNDQGKKYIGVGGMRYLAQYLEEQAVASGLVTISRPQWVDRIQYNATAWTAKSRGKDLGLFDGIVVAHNGKCANRLTAPMGIPTVHGQLRRLKLSANWVLMVAFEQPLELNFEGSFIKNNEVLSWAANNTAKLSLSSQQPECWTLISTMQYGKLNKVPQENIPIDVAHRVTQEMLQAFEQALNLPKSSSLSNNIAFSRVQLWGAALPINSPNVPCIWDAESRCGVTGDWVNGGGSFQNAVLSGVAMADRIDATRGVDMKQAVRLNMGLEDKAVAVKNGEDIGIFP